MHTKYCTRAMSARSAVRDLIGNQQREISDKFKEFERKERKRLDEELGIDAIDAEIEVLNKRRNKLYTAREARLKAATAEFASQFKKRSDRLCDLRSEVLFAKTSRLREMHAELTAN